MKKVTSIGALVVAAGVLAACSGGRQTLELCSEGSYEFTPYDSRMGAVFNGSANQNQICRVNGYDLSSEFNYKFSGGLLAVYGDIAEGTRINVDDGKLYVRGDISSDARISVKADEDIRSESYMTMMAMPNGNGGVRMQPMPQTRYIFEGFERNRDHDPIVIVEGTIEDGARVSANKDVHARDFGDKAKVSLSRGAEAQRGLDRNYYISPELR